jgi:DNA invertase Pin-like site-specific DNA recombinase
MTPVELVGLAGRKTQRHVRINRCRSTVALPAAGIAPNRIVAAFVAAPAEIGLILSIDVTRLARNCTDWYPLVDICGLRGCLIADRDGVYDPGNPNGRLLLGLKGTTSELEHHTIRSRLTAGLLAKAERGELELSLPIVLVRDPSGIVVKDPDMAVQERLGLVFELS